MRKFLLFLFLTISSGLFAQQQRVLYFDADWVSLPDTHSASYYRIVLLDSLDDKPLTHVKDYYITGELQFEGDEADPLKMGSLKEGLATWYYKNGQKST